MSSSCQVLKKASPTCASSGALRRYWLADSYEARHAAGQEPQNIDKEFLRLWFRDNCDPYTDEVGPHKKMHTAGLVSLPVEQRGRLPCAEVCGGAARANLLLLCLRLQQCVLLEPVTIVPCRYIHLCM